MSLILIFNWKGSGLKARRHAPRSEQERELRGEGWGATMTDEQLDKAKHLERKAEEQTGAKAPFFNLAGIDEVK